MFLLWCLELNSKSFILLLNYRNNYRPWPNFELSIKICFKGLTEKMYTFPTLTILGLFNKNFFPFLLVYCIFWNTLYNTFFSFIQPYVRGLILKSPSSFTNIHKEFHGKPQLY